MIFGGGELIHLNSLNIRSETWQWSLKSQPKQKYFQIKIFQTRFNPLLANDPIFVLSENTRKPKVFFRGVFLTA